MSDLKVTYSISVIIPTLVKSTLTVPDKSGRAWEHVDCGDVHLVVKFDRTSMLPDGSAAFLKWIFYAQVNGIWAEVEWDNLTEEYKIAAFNKIVMKHKWLPFYDQDILPPWEDAWFTLAALGQA